MLTLPKTVFRNRETHLTHPSCPWWPRRPGAWPQRPVGTPGGQVGPGAWPHRPAATHVGQGSGGLTVEQLALLAKVIIQVFF